MILGVTGNIASGKSTVVGLLREKGAEVLSADQLARDVVAPGSELLATLVKRFGIELLRSDGSLDREALGKRVFADAGVRLELEGLLHPAIGALAEERLRQLRTAGAALVVYEAPLLFEAGAEGRVDQVLVVSVDEDVQLQRLLHRDGFDEAEARKRIDAQMPQAEKIIRADYLIDNSGSKLELQMQVEQLWRELVG